MSDSSRIGFVCAKCGHTGCDTDEFRATGGNFAKIFDDLVQNKKFNTVSCTQCGFTEIYRGDTATLGNIFDFFSG